MERKDVIVDKEKKRRGYKHREKGFYFLLLHRSTLVRHRHVTSLTRENNTIRSQLISTFSVPVFSPRLFIISNRHE